MRATVCLFTDPELCESYTARTLVACDVWAMEPESPVGQMPRDSVRLYFPGSLDSYYVLMLDNVLM